MDEVMGKRLIPLIIASWACLTPYAAAETARAAVKATSDASDISGTVFFEDSASGLKVTAEILGLTPGLHGFHIHEFGSCADAGKAAGGHFNPSGAPHGLMARDGALAAHPGDMGNLETDANGVSRLETALPGVTLSQGPLSVAGRSVIVHENPDDFSQPTGNAGGRAACGEILIVPSTA